MNTVVRGGLVSGVWDRLAGLAEDHVDIWKRLDSYRTAPSVPPTVVDNQPQGEAQIGKAIGDFVVDLVVDDPPPDVDWPEIPERWRPRATGADDRYVSWLAGQMAHQQHEQRRTRRVCRDRGCRIDGVHAAHEQPGQRRPRLVRDPGGGGRA